MSSSRIARQLSFDETISQWKEAEKILATISVNYRFRDRDLMEKVTIAKGAYEDALEEKEKEEQERLKQTEEISEVKDEKTEIRVDADKFLKSLGYRITISLPRESKDTKDFIQLGTIRLDTINDVFNMAFNKNGELTGKDENYDTINDQTPRLKAMLEAAASSYTKKFNDDGLTDKNDNTVILTVILDNLLVEKISFEITKNYSTKDGETKEVNSVGLVSYNDGNCKAVFDINSKTTATPKRKTSFLNNFWGWIFGEKK